MMNNLFFKKKRQRQKYLKIRKNINRKQKYIFHPKFIDKFFDNIRYKNINIISSFISINNEIPTLDLNNYIISKNKILSFPVVEKKNNILLFREYKKNQNLIRGNFKIPEPPRNNRIVIPDLLFVPCLAFDKEGYRLGYGGGYYDKTFSYFDKIKHQFISIGFAYEDQMAENIYKDKFDFKLDYIFTEKKLYIFS